jgi:ADP-ribose pyrophosphatase
VTQKNNIKNETVPFGKKDYELVKRDLVYAGVFTLARYHVRHKLFHGGWSETFVREVLERFSASAVLPYDPILDRVILIEQFRPGCLANPEGPWCIEIPAGVLVGDDTFESLARNEAEEEAGCSITELNPICDYFVSPGGANEYLHLYCGKVDASHVGGVHGLKHEHEDIRVINVTFDQAIAKLARGEIKTSPAIISLLWLQVNRDKLRQLWRAS